jgi:hypothetical protein
MAINFVDLDKKAEERKISVNPNYNHLNNIGNVELANRIQALTLEEKMVVAQNLPVDIMLGVIEREFERYQALEAKLSDILKRFDK